MCIGDRFVVEGRFGVDPEFLVLRLGLECSFVPYGGVYGIYGRRDEVCG